MFGAICTSLLVTKIKEAADQKEIEIGIDVLPVEVMDMRFYGTMNGRAIL